MENKTEKLLKEQKILLYKVVMHLENIKQGKYDTAIRKATKKK